MPRSSLSKSEHHAGFLICVWAILVVMTLASAWLSDHGLPLAVGTALVLVLTFVKVFIVGRSFMELRLAPPMLRHLFATWCAATCLTLVILARVP